MRQMLDEFKEKPKEQDESEDRLETSLLTGKQKRARKKQQFLEKMEGMTKKEKAGYIIYYYKWWFIGTAAAIVFVAGIIISIYKNSRPVSISCAILNPAQAMNVQDAPLKEFVDAKGLNKGTRMVADIYYHININYEMSSQSESNRASTLSLQSANDYYDVFITDRDGLEFAAFQGLIYPLDRVLGAEAVEKYKDRLYNISDYSDPALAADVAKATTTDELAAVGNRDLPIGIDVSDTEFIKRMDLGDKKIYLCFSCKKEKRIERATMLLNYIFGEE
ncbi:MAG: hypothetical protein K6C35_09965 [Eubacterium sp.]|nr:hypothetical protein [Eubacterium sp.]